jgi:hypothetical protein
MTTFPTLIAQSSRSIGYLEQTLDGRALSLKQDIALMAEKIDLLNTEKKSYLAKKTHKTIQLSDIMSIILIIKESIQEESLLAGLAHEFLNSLPQEASEHLNWIVEKSETLYLEVFDSGIHAHQNGLEVTYQVKNSYIQEADSIIEKYEKWLMETKASYELKLQKIRVQ